jgi:lipoate-protein ligase B
MNCRALSNKFFDRTCFVADLGVTAIPETERLMAAAGLLRARGETPDTLFLLAHPKTVAVGLKDLRSERPKDLLVSLDQLEREGIALTRSVRGGGITYHWPGQVVCYPIVALTGADRDIPGYMRRLEQVGLDTLERFGLTASRRRDSAAHVGLWLDRKKIVSMGVRVSNWITSFGFAVNLEGDVAPSRYVRPCGLEEARLTTVQEALGHAPSRQSVIDAVRETFSTVFHRKTEKMPDDLFNTIRALAQYSDQMITGSGRCT